MGPPSPIACYYLLFGGGGSGADWNAPELGRILNQQGRVGNSIGPRCHVGDGLYCVVGMLLYLSGHTCPDLTYSVIQVARFMFAPNLFA